MEHEQGNHTTFTKTERKWTDFIPLAVIFAFAIGLGFYSAESATFMQVMTKFMGWLLIILGGFKAVKLKGFAEAYSVYDIVAKRWFGYGYVYPFFELALGTAFLFGVYLVWAAFATLALMLLGAAGVYLELRKKNYIPCACLGTVFKLPMTKVTLFEDLLMAAMAGYMIFNF